MGTWPADYNYMLEKCSKLCDLAAEYDVRAIKESVTWSCIPGVATAARLIKEAGRENVGFVVNVLHCYRLHNDMDVLQSLPKEWFGCAHLCDCAKEIPTDNETLFHNGCAERLYSDEETIPIKEIANQISWLVCVVEVLRIKHLGELGLDEHARCALQATKRVMDEE